MRKFVTFSSLIALALFTFTFQATAADQFTINNTPTLGQSLELSGSCGSNSDSDTASVVAIRNGARTNLGSLKVNSNGDFSDNVDIPSNYGGGPVAFEVRCAGGEVLTVNSAVTDPFATVSNSSPKVGSSFVVRGVCGTTAGGEVTIDLVQAAFDTKLGTATTTSGGNFSATVSTPSSAVTGIGTLFVMCPTGTTMTRLVTIDRSVTGGVVDVSNSSTTNGSANATNGTSIVPTGGVAAGKTNANWFIVSAITLFVLGILSWAGVKKLDQASHN